MELGLTGRRAAVAGSSAGLGLAAAAALAREGAHVAICGRDPDRLAAAAEGIRAGGGAVEPLRVDVGTPDGAASFVERAAVALGGAPEILVANGGGPPPGTFASTALEDYGAAVESNLLSTIAMCQHAVPPMQAAGWGRVVAITSVGARQPIGTLIASTVARTGVTGFLKVLASEVAADGVTVNSVQPGVHATERLASLATDALDSLRSEVPSGRLGDPADLGEIIAFLCGRAAGFVTGVGLVVDGGATRALQ